MRNNYIAVTALISALILIAAVVIFRYSAKSLTASSSSSAATLKLNARAEAIKALEVRAAKSDPTAQLALAKLLLDGTDTPPNYKRARGLLLSASKQLPEAIVGLEVLQSWGFIKDKSLPNAETLSAQALATQDVFAIEYLSTWSTFKEPDPPDWVIKLASSGNPYGEAKLASYYGRMSQVADECQASQDLAKKEKLAGYNFPSPMKCSPVPKVLDSRELAKKYASAIVDAKEVEAGKIRYWTALGRRMVASQHYKSVAGAPGEPPLFQMYFDNVDDKVDPYSSVIAYGLSLVGEMLEKGNVGYDDPALSAQFFTRAAELGDAEAQDRLGDLYKAGSQQTLKDFDMAARYFAQSAQQANEYGMMSLGLAFIRGQGVEQNKVQAYFWLSLSNLGSGSVSTGIGLAQLQVLQRTPGYESYGDEMLDHRTVRDELAQTMTPQEIAEGQRLAREWLPSYQVGPPPSIASINAGTVGSAPKEVAAPSEKLIAMQKDGGGYVVPVLIDNTITLNFVVDSGASDVTIPSDVVTTLMRTGALKQSDFLDTQTYVLADGSKVPSRTFRIQSLKIGDTVVENVIGSVAPAQGSLLLGQSFLGHFKSWSIDNTKHALVLE